MLPIKKADRDSNDSGHGYNDSCWQGQAGAENTVFTAKNAKGAKNTMIHPAYRRHGVVFHYQAIKKPL